MCFVGDTAIISLGDLMCMGHWDMFWVVSRVSWLPQLSASRFHLFSDLARRRAKEPYFECLKLELKESV